MKKVVLVLGCMVVSAVTTVVFLSNESHTVHANESGLPLKELRMFSDIYARVKHSYVDEVEDEELIKGAIDGMLATLDPYSVYLKKEAHENLRIGTTGKFGGLGIVVDTKDDFVEVVSPIDDTPASRAGIEAGDMIVRIDETVTKGMLLSEAVKMMRGVIGTKIKLLIKRESIEQPFEVELTRAEIKVKSARGVLLEPGYGYVRLTRFQTNTSADMGALIAKLTKENKQPLQGLILDLRNNPGGLLTAAVQVVDYFVGKGKLVVYTKGRRADSMHEYKSASPDSSSGVPLVVLINAGSASASEIVSGALQDLQRATVVGETSYGKGSVQTIHPLQDETALKLTTAKYYTPAGKVIHENGVSPNVALEFEELSEEDLAARKELNIYEDMLKWLSYDSQVKTALIRLKELAMGTGAPPPPPQPAAQPAMPQKQPQPVPPTPPVPPAQPNQAPPPTPPTAP